MIRAWPSRVSFGVLPLSQSGWSLRARVMALAAMLLAPMLALLFALIETVGGHIRVQFTDDALASQSLAASRFNQAISSTMSDLTSLADSRQIANTDTFGTAVMLRILYNSQPEVQSVFATDEFGNIYSSSHNLNAARQINIAHEPIFRSVFGRGHPTVAGPVDDPITNQSSLLVGVPVRNSIGRPTGIIVAVISLFRLSDLMDSFLTQHGDRMAIMGADGQMLVSLGWESPSQRDWWLTRLARQPGATPTGPTVSQFRESYFGSMSIGVSGPIGSTALRLVLVREDGPLGLPPGTTLDRAFAYGLLAVVMTFMIASRIGNWLSRPLELLTAAVGRITSGQFDSDVAVPPRVHDPEILRLVTAFNRMAASLRERKAQVAMQQEELQRYSEQLRELLGEVLHTQEEERHRISVDLHDSVAQQLTGVHYEIQAALGHLRSGENAAAVAALAQATAVLRSASEEMRSVIYSLRPPTLEQQGLVSAIAELSHSYLAIPKRVEIKFAVDGEPYPLAWAQEIALYRVAQESLTNTWKHAPGATAFVRLRYLSDAVVLQVHDTGKGFDPRTPPGGRARRLGFIGMRERIEQVGGSLQIEAAIGHGTTVVATIARANAGPAAALLPDARAAGSRRALGVVGEER